MANYNLVTKNVSVPTSSGTKNYYNLVLVDEDTGQIKSAIMTDKQSEVEDFIVKAKKEDPNVKFNGKSGVDPFSDGTLTKQKNYDIATSDQELNNESDFGQGALNTNTLGSPSSGPGDYSSYNTLNNFDPTLPPLSSRDLGDLSPSSMLNLSIFEKKSRDLSGMPEEKRKQFENLSEEQRGKKNINGVFGTKRVQARIKRETTASELVVARGPDNNAFIVLGNDRASKPHTGYGGKGHTQCDSIDLVAGLGGHKPKEVEKVEAEGGDSIESEIKTNPNFFLDSARIYISQKIDVDKNFGIGEFGPAEEGKKDNKDNKDIGKYGAKSAIVTKADNIRIIGRESIRIVTGTDKFNSQGGEVLGKSGVELVAMNDTKALQPIVLGDNLIELLDTIITQIEGLANISNAARKYQMKMNQALQQHVHLSPFFAIPTTVSPQAAAGGIQCDIETMTKTELSDMKQSTNLQGIRHNYLTESGSKFINSKLNKVN